MNFERVGKIAQHDLKIIIRMILQTFSTVSDIALLVFAAPFLIAALINGFEAASVAISSWGSNGTILISLILIMLSVIVTRSRIKWHQDYGILAPIALRPETFVVYCAISIFIVSLPIFYLVEHSWQSLFDFSFGIAFTALELVVARLIFVRVWPKVSLILAKVHIYRNVDELSSRETRARSILARLVAIPVFTFSKNVVFLVCFGTFLGMLFVVLRNEGVDSAKAIFLVGLVMISLLSSMLWRIPHSLPRTLVRLGVSPFAACLALIALAGALLSSFALVATIFRPAEFAALGTWLIISMAIFSFVATLQMGHYSLRARQAANTAIQIEIAALALAASLIGPLVAIIAIIRIGFLRRSIQRRMWLLG